MEEQEEIKARPGPLRPLALNLLRLEKTDKTGAKNRRLRAEWNSDYLIKVITS
jgi:hypothetical protein